MPCERIGNAIVCRRGPEVVRKCSVCHDRRATRLCDGKVPTITNGYQAWATCDAALCRTCARQVGDLDYCPAHQYEATR
jgi:hypothetical protein